MTTHSGWAFRENRQLVICVLLSHPWEEINDHWKICKRCGSMRFQDVLREELEAVMLRGFHPNQLYG